MSPISRKRAKVIHEMTGWAFWASAGALVLRVTFMREDVGFDLITGCMIMTLVCMGIVWLFLPAVPVQRRKPAKKRKVTTYRGRTTKAPAKRQSRYDRKTVSR